jgi:hypothetical protein
LSHAGPVVHAVDRIDRKAGEQAVLDHLLAAAFVLLGGLKDEVDGAVEIPCLGKIARGPEQHRRVAVMAAGMHDALMRRGVRAAGLLLDRQRIHVGAQRDGALAAAATQRADHAGPGEAAIDRDAESGERRGDEIGCPVLLEGHLRMGMDIVSPRDHLGMELGDAVDDGHGSLRGVGSDPLIASPGRSRRIERYCAARDIVPPRYCPGVTP